MSDFRNLIFKKIKIGVLRSGFTGCLAGRGTCGRIFESSTILLTPRANAATEIVRKKQSHGA
jgi:hypothetical protein